MCRGQKQEARRSPVVTNHCSPYQSLYCRVAGMPHEMCKAYSAPWLKQAVDASSEYLSGNVEFDIDAVWKGFLWGPREGRKKECPA